MRYRIENLSAVGIGVVLGALARPPWGRFVLFALGLAVTMGTLESTLDHLAHVAERRRDPTRPKVGAWAIPAGGVFIGLFSWAPVMGVVGLITYGLRRLAG
jgi:hypothetical protein